MIFVDHVEMQTNSISYPSVCVRFQATTNNEASALYRFFFSMLGRVIDPYKMHKPNELPTARPAEIVEVRQIENGGAK